MIAPDRRFVYIIQSDRNRMRYVGSTSDVARRVATHNSGGSEFTSPHRPWSVLVSIEFRSEQAAFRFERYLKTGSGRAFAKRHFA
jgi:predicted GIY-YIG superfamily endonuclease